MSCFEIGNIMKDLYPKVLSFLDLRTLMYCKLVNKNFYEKSKKEIIDRIKSPYLFGDKKSQLSVLVSDESVEKIFIISEGYEFEVPKNKYRMAPIRHILNSWFCYNMNFQSWITTGKITKWVVKHISKLREKEMEEFANSSKNLYIFFLFYPTSDPSKIESVLTGVKGYKYF